VGAFSTDVDKLERAAVLSALPRGTIIPVTDQRFLTLSDVAEILNTSDSQIYALVRRGDLPAIKIGGRGQWRVEAVKLEEYISQMYAQTESFVAEHPFEEPELENISLDSAD
jgi:excisionase family DNA binding protein